MRSIIFAAVLSLALVPVAFAKAPCFDAHHRFMKCAPAVPAGATAKCRDGTLSFSQHHQGTCSHHGGVSAWLH